MATGYTHEIKDGISFEDYVWRCARGFGALIEMRDSPADAPIPERIKASTYHAERLTETHAELGRLTSMTPDEAEEAATAAYAEEVARHEQRQAERLELKWRYEAMLERVKRWSPPTPDHKGLKDFMAEQIEKSIDWDCSPITEKPVHLTGDQWRSTRLAVLHRDVAYSDKGQQEEIARTEERNQWLAALKDSLKEPVLSE